jgi:hypothetical protein
VALGIARSGVIVYAGNLVVPLADCNVALILVLRTAFCREMSGNS